MGACVCQCGRVCVEAAPLLATARSKLPLSGVIKKNKYNIHPMKGEYMEGSSALLLLFDCPTFPGLGVF